MWVSAELRVPEAGRSFEVQFVRGQGSSRALAVVVLDSVVPTWDSSQAEVTGTAISLGLVARGLLIAFAGS